MNLIDKHGDPDNVVKDIISLNDIIRRQGTHLVIEALGESVGNTCKKFGLSEKDKMKILGSLISELTNSISEKL